MENTKTLRKLISEHEELVKQQEEVLEALKTLTLHEGEDDEKDSIRIAINSKNEAVQVLLRTYLSLDHRISVLLNTKFIPY